MKTRVHPFPERHGNGMTETNTSAVREYGTRRKCAASNCAIAIDESYWQNPVDIKNGNICRRLISVKGTGEC